MNKLAKKITEIKIDTLFVLDEETKFLVSNFDKQKCQIIKNSSELTKVLNIKFQVKSIVLLVELDWGYENHKFYGYEVAKELMNSPNRQSKFNLLFISTFSRETLYEINKNSSRVFTKSFQHRTIESLRSFDKIQIIPISDRKFDYLRRYCLTETGILEKLEHDLRPSKIISESQIEDLFLQLKANSDLVGLKVMNVLNETNTINFQRKRGSLYEYLVYRIQEVAKNKNIASNIKNKELWKPLLLLIEDDSHQCIQMENSFSPYFSVAPVNNGLDAFKYLQTHLEQVSVVVCDMELLNESNLDDDIQGIDVIEFIKEHYPHIVLKVVSHLPRRGLNMLLGDILKASDLLYKSMLLDGNVDFISDLAKEIQSEIDLRRTFQKLRGPLKALWGNSTKQGNPGGRLTQFYYDFRNDPNLSNEFNQMWEEIDLKVEAILQKKSTICTRFPSTEDRKAITKLPLTKSLVILKELLINRLFWIKVLYSGSQEEKVKFDDFKGYFDTKFLLFSTDEKRFSHYATLTGFSIKQASNEEHILTFNQFLLEEFNRVKAASSVLVFDPTNSYLIDVIYDILDIIVKAGTQAFLIQNNYPTCPVFWHEDNKIPFVTKTLELLANEKPSKDLRSTPQSREKISELLLVLKTQPEYKTYPHNIKQSINKALINLDKK